MADPIEVKVTLDLDRYLIDKGIRYDQDGEPIGGESRTMEDLILDLAAQQVVAGLDRDLRRELGQRVRDIRDEVIREAIAPIIEESLSGQIVRTNAYGEPTGHTTTLREIIAADAKKALTLNDRDMTGRRYNETPASKVMQAEVDRVVKAEVKAIVDTVKAETYEAIKVAAADAIAKAAS